MNVQVFLIKRPVCVDLKISFEYFFFFFNLTKVLKMKFRTPVHSEFTLLGVTAIAVEESCSRVHAEMLQIF